MKLYKSILYVLSILFLVSSVSAALTDGNELYYSMDTSNISGTTIYDLSVNGVDGTLVGGPTTGEPGIINESVNFTQPTEYINTDSLSVSGGTYTIDMWVYPRNLTTTEFLFDSNHASGRLAISPSHSGKLAIYDGAWRDFTEVLTLDTWTYILVEFNATSSTASLYVNNVFKDSVTYFSVSNLGTLVGIARNTGTAGSFTGSIDEFSIWNRVLTTQERATRYASGSGFNPYAGVTPTTKIITIENINVTNSFTYNSTFNRYYVKNVSTILTNLSVTNTNTNVNGTYLLNYTTNSSEFTGQYMTNELNNITNFTLPFEGIYKFTSTYFNNETETNSTGFFLFSDNTAPVITPIGNLTQNEYEVNFSTIFNVTDNLSGLYSCNLNITYLTANESDSNFFINCTDTQTFTRAGLYNGLITATDKSGNVQTLSVNGTVNPLLNITYQNSVTLAKLFDYSVRVTHPDGRIETKTSVNGSIFLSPVNNGTLDLGNHTLQFIKPGFIKSNSTVLVNTTNAGTSVLLNASQVTLSIKVFDITSPSTQIPFNLTIINSSDSISYTNQVNFSANYNETVTGTIQLVINSVGYSQVYFWNTLAPFTAITLDAFMFPVNDSDVLQFTVLDTADNSAIPAVTIELQKLINGTYKTIAQSITESSGKTFFFADSSLSYRAIFTKEGYTQAIATTIPSVLEYTLKLSTSAVAFTYVDDINYVIKPTSKLLQTNTTIPFSAFISGTSITLSNVTLYYDNGSLIYSSSSTNPTGTTFSNSFVIPVGANVSTITATLTWVRDGVINTATKQYEVFTFTNTSIMKTLDDYGKDDSDESMLTKWFIIMIIVLMIIIAGTLTGVTSVNFMLVPALAFFAYIGWVDWVSSAVAIFIMLVFFIGGRTK